MPFNWKEMLVKAGLPFIAEIEEQVVDSTLDDYFAKHPEAYKKLIPLAYSVFSQLQVVFAESKIGAPILKGFVEGIEDSAKDCGVELS